MTDTVQAAIDSPSAGLPAVIPPKPRAPRRWLVGSVDCMIGLMVRLMPYALIALLLRAVMGGIFFITGQAMVDGPQHRLKDIDYALTWPESVRAETLRTFERAFAGFVLPAEMAAFIVACALCLFGLLLVIGLATRFAALGLIVLTYLLDRHLAPGQFSSLYLYWYLILLVLISQGAGTVSIDWLLRFLRSRRRPAT